MQKRSKIDGEKVTKLGEIHRGTQGTSRGPLSIAKIAENCQKMVIEGRNSKTSPLITLIKLIYTDQKAISKKN